jgi:hypothetical protein
MPSMVRRAWDWYRSRGRYHRNIAVSDLLIAGSILALWFIWSDPKIYGQVCAVLAALFFIGNQLENHRILGGEIVLKDGKQTPRLVWYLGQAVWWWIVSVTWACLGGLLLILGVAWTYGYQVSLLALAVAGAVLVAVQYVARLQARGWVIDDRGERQKVNYWLGDTAIYAPTTRQQRIVEEGVRRQQRRRNLAIGAAILAGCSLTTWWIIEYHQHDFRVMLLLFSIPYGVFGAGHVVYQSILEMLYLTGFQHMKGAKVLDPEPYKPGSEVAANQKAHGDARPATENEALQTAEQGGQRLPVHDMEF